MNFGTMIDAAAAAHPNEACGVVVNGHVYEITNRSNRPSEFFVMDMDELRNLAPLGQPTALWHSHPGGSTEPSSADLEHHPSGMRLYIVANGQVYDHGIPT